MRKTILTIAIYLVNFGSMAQTNQQSSTKNENAMNFQDVYTVFITKDLRASKKFYTQWFGFDTAFESTFFILLTSPGDRSFSLGLMSEVHPSSPPSNPAMNAQAGAFLTLQTADAKSDYEKLKKAGLTIYYHLKDEPWGQRRFGVLDPNGMYVDIVEQTEPQKGFWEKYMFKD